MHNTLWNSHQTFSTTLWHCCPHFCTDFKRQPQTWSKQWTVFPWQDFSQTFSRFHEFPEQLVIQENGSLPCQEAGKNSSEMTYSVLSKSKTLIQCGFLENVIAGHSPDILWHFFNKHITTLNFVDSPSRVLHYFLYCLGFMNFNFSSIALILQYSTCNPPVSINIVSGLWTIFAMFHCSHRKSPSCIFWK